MIANTKPTAKCETAAAFQMTDINNATRNTSE
jgi:hypothetical protein